jgi:hypothetical protein
MLGFALLHPTYGEPIDQTHEIKQKIGQQQRWPIGSGNLINL